MSRRLVDGQLPVRPATAKKGGKPNDLELKPELMTKVEQALMIGCPVETAFAFQGVPYDTLRAWVLRGKESPHSIYGSMINRVVKAVSEWEIRDIAVLEAHAQGRPATYEMEVVRDGNGEVIYDGAKPLMQVAKDGSGNPIIRSHAIKSDWRAALERLSRRKGKHWAARDRVEIDMIMTLDSKAPESREVKSFDEKIADAIKKFDDEYK